MLSVTGTMRHIGTGIVVLVLACLSIAPIGSPPAFADAKEEESAKLNTQAQTETTKDSVSVEAQGSYQVPGTTPGSGGGGSQDGHAGSSGSRVRASGSNSGEQCITIGDWRFCEIFMGLDRKAAAPAPDPKITNIRTVSFRVAAEWKAPVPTINLGPDPEKNMWQMMVVGYPMWLWTDGYTTTTTSVSKQGITVKLTGVPLQTTFDMGDGKTKSCAYQREWTKYFIDKTGPCYYRYKKASPEGTRYTITATTSWRVTWSAAGYQGVAYTTSTASTTVKVGELQAIGHNPNRYTPPPKPITTPPTQPATPPTPRR